MTDKAHTFTPKDDSLSSRVSAYKTVARDYSNAEASMKFADNKEWVDTLGEKDEIKQAHKIMQRSMKMATEKISLDEIKKAKEQGFINQDELVSFVKNKRLQELKSSREKSQQKQKSHNQRQR